MQHAYLSNYNANQGSNYGCMSCDQEKKNLSHTIFSGGQLSINIHHTYV